jgi:hypothetical protein
MLWLIWIALMLLVPAAAGVQVWFQLRRVPADAPAVSSVVGNAQPNCEQDERQQLPAGPITSDVHRVQ